MAGILVQSKVGDTVISDSLSSRSAVRGVIASNVRERAKLHYLDKSYDRGTCTSRCDYNHMQTLTKLRNNKLMKRANEEKARRQKELDKIQKAIEEREKKKIKSKGKTPFAFGRVKPLVNKESNMTTFSVDDLKDFIDDLDLSEEEEGSVAAVEATETELGPLMEQDEMDEVDETPSELPNLNRSINMTSRSPSRSSLPSKASVKTKPVLPSRASNLQRPGLGRHKTSLTPEAIKALAVKLGATDPAEELDPSASAGRLLQVLQETDEEEAETTDRLRKLTRLLSRANFVSEGGGALPRRNTKRNNTSDRFLDKYYHMPMALPPIWSAEAGGFPDREWENRDHQEPRPLTEDEWQDVKWCRYIRFSKKFHNSTEIVALDLNDP